ncbi:MAG: peroxiredoxin family protein [Candidatus Nanopelagicales bacterium]|nr:peroxiredoxin family protein [Candidatus Nanopelagicales bacterium]MDZ4249561.1 peroxiredoxin family protein [Candidatus Nanopelagicales bacterium]
MSSPSRAEIRRRAREISGEPRSKKTTILIGVIVIAAIAAVVAAMMFSAAPEQSTDTKPAPPFSLTDTAGKTVSLSEFAGKPVLLYFNEGVGCDTCFYQQVEIEKHSDELKNLGIVEFPVVMNPAEQVATELERFKIKTPYLIDSEGTVSKAYGVLGKGMHEGLPGHGFVLIDADGQIVWQMEDPSMSTPWKTLDAGIKENLAKQPVGG